jgi:TRAP-type C4-dicarboxylate transport system permease small subunit
MKFVLDVAGGIAMSRLLSAVQFIPRIVLVILMIIMLVDMMLGVFFRYIVGQALFWSEEVGTLCLIWITFIGGAMGITRGTHFSVHLLLDALRPRQQQMLRTAIALLIMVFGLVVGTYGYDLIISNSTSETPGLGLNLGVQYASAFVGGVMIVIYALTLAVEALRGSEARQG